VLAAMVAIFMELPVSLAVAVGALTRLSAVLMALYTVGTSLVEHRYWAAKGGERLMSMENFYKNLSITGGFLLLYVAGPGKYSIDALLGIAAR
jgi:putative oxidoreductase